MTEKIPDPQRIHRKLAAIFAADVAGYSRLMSLDEEQTTRLLRSHRKILDALIKEFGGRIANTAGDSVLAEFPSSVDAVRCALAVQEALQTKNLKFPKEQWLQFRIGVNAGDVIIQDGDLLGDGVNIASRLEAIAEPGGICISDDVRNQIEGKLTLKCVPLGAKNLKNIPRPVPAFMVTNQTVSNRTVSFQFSQSVSRNVRKLSIIVVLIVGLLVLAAWFFSQALDRFDRELAQRSVPSTGFEQEIPEARRGTVLKTGTFGGHEYHLMASSGIKWAEAETSARAMKGYLVAIESQEENAFIVDMIRDEDQVWRRREEGSRWQRFGPWIGLVQRDKSNEPSGGWLWSNGEAVTFDGWFFHQPDNYDSIEDFGRFREFSDQDGIKWDDARGHSAALGYIVEFESD